MAILRGGRRIFGTDIRFGIPRDRSLDNVQNDPRLRRVQGNPESTLGRFVGKMAEGEGFARPNRFMVDFILPKALEEQATNEAGVINLLSKKKYNDQHCWSITSRNRITKRPTSILFCC